MAQTKGLSLLGRVLLDPYFGPRGSLFLGFRGVLRFSISMIFVFFWSFLGPWGPFHQIGLIERIRMVWISSSGMPWGPSYDQKRVLIIFFSMILLISPFWGLGVLTVRRALENHHDGFKNQLLRFHFDPKKRYTLWNAMGFFDDFLYKIHFILSYQNLIRSDQTWSDLIRSNQIWSDLIRSDQIRSDQIWSDLRRDF